ncbi:MAG: hypothetical protein K0T53_00100 [Wolbachia pipientis]|nr:hypothetical protein [Wolbachia pipientis]
MSDITKKYNKFENCYFNKLKANKKLIIYAFNTYIIITISIGYLELITRSSPLISPLTILIFRPIIWIILGLVFTLIYKVAVKILYNLTKDFLNKKETNQNLKQTPNDNNNIVLDSKPNHQNSSNISITTSKNNNSNTKEFYENLPTLTHQTNRKNYSYWLQQHDIAHIARAVYNYTESSDNYISFCIPGNLETLNERLIE